MTIICSHCGQPVTAPDANEAKTVYCSACGKTVRPSSSSEEANAVTPPKDPQLKNNVCSVMPPHTPMVSSYGTFWITTGTIIFWLAFFWTLFFFFIYGNVEPGSTGNRIAGLIVGSCAALGGLAMIGIGYIGHCMTYLQISLRLQHQCQQRNGVK